MGTFDDFLNGIRTDTESERHLTIRAQKPAETIEEIEHENYIASGAYDVKIIMSAFNTFLKGDIERATLEFEEAADYLCKRSDKTPRSSRVYLAKYLALDLKEMKYVRMMKFYEFLLHVETSYTEKLKHGEGPRAVLDALAERFRSSETAVPKTFINTLCKEEKYEEGFPNVIQVLKDYMTTDLVNDSKYTNAKLESEVKTEICTYWLKRFVFALRADQQRRNRNPIFKQVYDRLNNVLLARGYNGYEDEKNRIIDQLLYSAMILGKLSVIFSMCPSRLRGQDWVMAKYHTDFKYSGGLKSTMFYSCLWSLERPQSHPIVSVSEETWIELRQIIHKIIRDAKTGNSDEDDEAIRFLQKTPSAAIEEINRQREEAVLRRCVEMVGPRRDYDLMDDPDCASEEKTAVHKSSVSSSVPPTVEQKDDDVKSRKHTNVVQRLSRASATIQPGVTRDVRDSLHVLSFTQLKDLSAKLAQNHNKNFQYKFGMKPKDTINQFEEEDICAALNK